MCSYGGKELEETLYISKRCLEINFNPFCPKSDLSQISHFGITGLSVREVMRIENMITQVKFSWYFNSFSPQLL